MIQEVTIAARIQANIFSENGDLGVIVMSPATGVQYLYENLSKWLAEKGYAVISFDYYGIGASRKHISPKEIGLDSIGHFSIFKSKYKENLWNDLYNDIQKF